MSDFIKKVKHPITGQLMDAMFLDNYYSSHEYGVGFKRDGGNVTFNTQLSELEFFKEDLIK